MTVDAQILAAMRAGGEHGVSGAALAQRLGISRAAVWNHVEELRRCGYDIEASPHHGYRLHGVPDVLHADDLMSRLKLGRIVGRDIRVFQRTTSTNDVVERLANDGVAEGIAVFAESQERGRGRLGREWVSPPGKGLWFSVLLRPRIPPQAATQLTVLSAVAVARAIERETGLKPEIKWPNDIVFGSRKCAGILIELGAELDHIRHVVLGIGVDVNLAAGDLPEALRPVATSLSEQAGRPLDRAALATAMLEDLDALYRRFRSGDFLEIADEWMRRCSTLGRDVEIRVGDRVIAGRAEALDDEGALRIRTEQGRLERIVGGDVTLARAHG